MGEIMYGGHIVEDWDRRLAAAYLHKYFNDGLLEGAQLFPAFYPPPSTMPHPQARLPAVVGWGQPAEGARSAGPGSLGLLPCLPTAAGAMQPRQACSLALCTTHTQPAARTGAGVH